jgi:hypothetical protein
MMGYSNSYDNHLDAELGLLAQAYTSGNKGSNTQPNYQCKCCGAKVYFFQSSSGGKVLFDSLGHPKMPPVDIKPSLIEGIGILN